MNASIIDLTSLTEPLTTADLVRGWYERGAITYHDLLMFHRAIGRERAVEDDRRDHERPDLLAADA